MGDLEAEGIVTGIATTTEMWASLKVNSCQDQYLPRTMSDFYTMEGELSASVIEVSFDHHLGNCWSNSAIL